MLYFIRHGESQANVDKIFAGPNYYAPLTENGKNQATVEGQHLKQQGIHFDRIISSPIERAKETAHLLAEGLGFPFDDITYDDRLVEYDMGDLSGQSMEDVSALEKTSANNAQDPCAFQEKVMTAIREITRLPGTTLVVSHAGVGRVIEAERIGLEPARFYDLEGYPNAKAIELNFG